MKFKIYRKFLLPFTILLLILCSCETHLAIKVGVLWNDDPHVSKSDSVYLSIMLGQWDSESGFDSDILATVEVLPGVNQCYCFTIATSNSDHYTAFIYHDREGNGKYDEGHDEVLGYKYNYGKEDGELNISLSAFY